MFTFEIFTLNRETMCHNVELHISRKTYEGYDYALTDGKEKAISLSLQIPNTLIELNMWDCEREEWVEEIVFENGYKVN